MNFDSLEYFSVLARERSFTRAAELLQGVHGFDDGQRTGVPDGIDLDHK